MIAGDTRHGGYGHVCWEGCEVMSDEGNMRWHAGGYCTGFADSCEGCLAGAEIDRLKASIEKLNEEIYWRKADTNRLEQACRRHDTRNKVLEGELADCIMVSGRAKRDWKDGIQSLAERIEKMKEAIERAIRLLPDEETEEASTLEMEIEARGYLKDALGEIND